MNPMTLRRPYSFIFTLAFVMLSLALPSCNGSKAFVKRAAKMEAAGMMPQAANLYYTAVMKKPTNIDAMVGLQRSGQVVLGQHIAEFDEAVAYNNRQIALSAWDKAVAWDKKLSAVGADLAFPEAKRAIYEGVKNAHLDETYRDANVLLEQENFAQALLKFDEVLRLDPAYQDAAALRNTAYCEPRYREGVLSQENEQLRSAHKVFKEIVDADAGYRDAADRLAQVLEDGRFTVALTEFKNGSSRINVEVKLQSLVEEALMGSSDPFLKVVDRESLAMILQEQSMGLNGLTSNGDVEIGNLLGAKALLKATITTCDQRQSRLNRSNKTGYESYRVERVNEEGKKYYETKYRTVSYREYYQDASVDVACTFKFISTVTGEVVSTQTVYGRASDNIRYIDYGGNRNTFYLGGSTGARTGSTGRSDRERLMNARRTIKSGDALTEEACLQLASQIQGNIESELLKLIP